MFTSTKQDVSVAVTDYEASQVLVIIKDAMADDTHRKYLSDLRGNQDVLLANIRRSPEFEAIEQKHLKNVFMGIYGLLNRVEGDDKNAHKVYACADEISDTFKISKENALRLLLKPQAPAAYSTRYLPHIRREGNEIVLRLHQKTTKKDINTVWRLVKDLQREIGGSGGKQSMNPELAYCIYRQHILKGRKIASIFKDYSHRRLEGYEGKPPTLSENDFRKYYKGVVEGL